MDIIKDFQNKSNTKETDIKRIIIEMMKCNKYRKKVTHQRYINIKVYNHLLELKNNLNVEIDLFDSKTEDKKQKLTNIENQIKAIKREQQLLCKCLLCHPSDGTYNIF